MRPRFVRGRFTREVRTDVNGSAAYDFTYEYDQGGNRTMKISPLSGFGGLRREVRYDYDVNRPSPDPEGYVTRNNRLMKVETFDITEDLTSESFTSPDSTTSITTTSLSEPTLQDSTLTGSTLLDPTTSSARAPQPPAEVETLVSTSWYYYSLSGNVERVVTNQANSFGQPTQSYSATRMGYAQNGQAVTFVVGETWNWSGSQGAPTTGYNVTYVREFRYDGARARYLVRELDAQDFKDSTYTLVVGGDRWTDYDGDTGYGDFELIPDGFDGNGIFIPAHGEATRSYEPGIGLVDPINTADGTSTSYYMADHLGTTRGMTDPIGAAIESAAFTAFGERVGGSARRFGYVGAFGYQTATSDQSGDAYADFPFQHVGARFYDPASGRFMQRDPIGVVGGLNVYSYIGNSPTDGIDPEGLQRAIRPMPIRRPLPRTPFEPPGFMKFPQPDTPFPDEFTRPRSLSNGAINCMMLFTGGPYIPPSNPPGPPGCTSCNNYDGNNHFHSSPPPSGGDGHSLWHPVRAAACAIFLYVLGWSVDNRKFRWSI